MSIESSPFCDSSGAIFHDIECEEVGNCVHLIKGSGGEGCLTTLRICTTMNDSGFLNDSSPNSYIRNSF